MALNKFVILATLRLEQPIISPFKISIPYLCHRLPSHKSDSSFVDVFLLQQRRVKYKQLVHVHFPVNYILEWIILLIIYTCDFFFALMHNFVKVYVGFFIYSIIYRIPVPVSLNQDSRRSLQAVLQGGRRWLVVQPLPLSQSQWPILHGRSLHAPNGQARH